MAAIGQMLPYTATLRDLNMATARLNLCAHDLAAEVERYLGVVDFFRAETFHDPEWRAEEEWAA